MYDQPVSSTTVIGALDNSSNPALQDQTLLNDVLVVVTANPGGGAPDTTVTITEQTVVAGNTITNIDASNDLALVTINKDPANPNATTTITANAVKNVEAFIVQGDGNVEITFNDSAAQGGPATTSAGATTPTPTAQRVVVTGAGSAKVTIADAKNTKLSLGTGNATVVTGSGVDTVLAGLGNSTITGGANGDYAIVKLAGVASNYTVATVGTHAVVTDKVTGMHTDISKIQYVEVSGGDALIFAKSTLQASIATLFEVTYGRTVDAATLDHYLDAGMTVQQVANELVAAPEFATRNQLDDRSFINSLYQNTFGRAGETAGIDYWMGAIKNNAATRADLVRSFAEIHTLNLAADGHGPGALHEAVLVGNITVVTGII